MRDLRALSQWEVSLFQNTLVLAGEISSIHQHAGRLLCKMIYSFSVTHTLTTYKKHLLKGCYEQHPLEACVLVLFASV